jgi:hypothetical protein
MLPSGRDCSYAGHKHLSQFQLIFGRDALKWLAVALDAVLKVAVPFGKRSEDLIGPRHRVRQWTAPAEADHGSYRKAMD